MRTAAVAMLVCVSIGTPVGAQVDVGITGGIPFNHFILDHSAGSRAGFSQVSSAPRRYIVGPFVEFRVRGPIGVQAGALYKRFGFDAASRSGAPAGPVTTINSFTTGNTLELPILATAHFQLFPRINGFLAAGPSIRRLFGITETGRRTVQTFFPPPGSAETADFQTTSPEGLNRRTSIGATLSAGVEFHTGPLRLAPTFRLTRWDTERTSSVSAGSRLARTQAEALLSIAYIARGDREAAPAQVPRRFEVGLLAGLPLLSMYGAPSEQGFTTIDAPTRRYGVGAFVDWRFHSRFSLEGSFLTRRFGHTETTAVPPDYLYAQSLTGYSWEVPLLLKCRVARIRSATLVIGGGPALRRASSVNWVSTLNGMRSRYDGLSTATSAIGASASGGLDLRAGNVRLRPELRYTRFGRPLYDLYTVRTRQDSLFLILGVGWIAGGR